MVQADEAISRAVRRREASVSVMMRQIRCEAICEESRTREEVCWSWRGVNSGLWNEDVVLWSGEILREV